MPLTYFFPLSDSVPSGLSTWYLLKELAYDGHWRYHGS